MSPPGPTSVTSDRVVALRRLSQRSFRQKVRRFLVEGPQAVREAVTHRPDAVIEVFVTDDAAGPAVAVADVARAAGLPVVRVPEPVLLAFTETVHPQGIAAVCSFLDTPVEEALRDARLVAVLHDVRDPGNAGTIIRTADAAGADAVVLAGDSVDPYNGKCVRSTAGSLFHVPIAFAPSTPAVIDLGRRAGLRVVAATGDAPTTLLDPDVRELLTEPLAWLFGNEAHGLPDEVVTQADATVGIPIYGAAESLNLAAAAAVSLYTTAFSQRT